MTLKTLAVTVLAAIPFAVQAVGSTASQEDVIEAAANATEQAQQNAVNPAIKEEAVNHKITVESGK